MDISRIEIKDMNFSYQDVKVYKKDLNLFFQRGYIYLIKGKNGSGKSTLSGILMRIWNDFKGTILLDDKNLREFSREAITEQIGVCFQKTAEKRTDSGNMRAGTGCGIQRAGIYLFWS